MKHCMLPWSTVTAISKGIFVVGVKSTGIFCRPTCTARKPKRENVEFFHSAHDALLHGYRPCKVCNPMQYKGAAPDWLTPLLNEINENPMVRLKDSDLRKRGLDPSRLVTGSKNTTA